MSGGGSGESGLWAVINSEGVATESVLSSYQNGLPPTEAYMEDISWLILRVLNLIQFSHLLRIR